LIANSTALPILNKNNSFCFYLNPDIGGINAEYRKSPGKKEAGLVILVASP